MPRCAYDIALKGYDGTEDTDNHVKWISAPSLLVLINFLIEWGLVTRVQSVDTLNPRASRFYTFADGIDVRIADDGKPHVDPKHVSFADLVLEWEALADAKPAVPAEPVAS